MGRWFMHICLTALLAAAGLAASGPAPEPYLTPATAVVPALLDVVRQPPHVRPYLRYISLYNTPLADRPVVIPLLNFTVNSLSRDRVPHAAVPITDTLYRIDLRDYHIDPATFDRLARLGSGPAPLPEPYFHAISWDTEPVYREEEWGYYRDCYGRNVADRAVVRANPAAYTWHRTHYEKVKVGERRVRHAHTAPWLPTVEAAELERQTHSDFPLLRLDWFVSNATIEPRYHELLGLGESKEDFERLAQADEAGADRTGNQIRGAILFSEVATHNRLLERTPTRARYGRGYFWESLDYLTSVDAQDVLVDPLNNHPDAQELIATLPNGLQAYGLADGKGRRIDFAVAGIAADHRSPYRDPQVYSARNCIVCHARGIVTVEDEVRQHASTQLALTLKGLRKSNPVAADRISAKYFEVNVSEFVSQDQQNYEAAVRGVTGLSGATVSLQFERLTVNYLEAPVTLDVLARDVGYPPEVVRGVIERTPGLSHVFTGLAKRSSRKARRDQLEAAFGQLAEAMLGVPLVPAVVPAGGGR